MNTELKDLISLVKKSALPVREVVESYMKLNWSLLTDEFNNRMTNEQREAFINKLEQERTHG